MGVKIHLEIEVEEFSTSISDGLAYSCRVTGIADGTKNTQVFNDPIEALDYARKLAFSWVQIFVQLKRSTKAKLHKQKMLKNVQKPKLIIP